LGQRAESPLARGRAAERRFHLAEIRASRLVNVVAVQVAAAAVWRFCIAPSHQERKIYMTAVFPSTTPMEAVEDGFHRLLDRSGRRHDSVQCPTGPNEQAVRAMRQHADDFNRQMGNEVVPVDWKPAATR
jgi:hypothetical protein